MYRGEKNKRYVVTK